MLLRSDTEWKKRISVVQRERRRIDLLNGMQLSNDCARRLEANINIFEKQAQMTQVLYSCGVQGAGPPPKGLVGSIRGRPGFGPNAADGWKLWGWWGKVWGLAAEVWGSRNIF